MTPLKESARKVISPKASEQGSKGAVSGTSLPEDLSESAYF